MKKLDQIANELFSRFGVNLPPAASKWLDDHVKSAIVKATEQITAEREHYQMLTQELGQEFRRAAHASELEIYDEVDAKANLPLEAHASEPPQSRGEQGADGMTEKQIDTIQKISNEWTDKIVEWVVDDIKSTFLPDSYDPYCLRKQVLYCVINALNAALSQRP